MKKYDPPTLVVVLFSPNGEVWTDVWESDGTHWTDWYDMGYGEEPGPM